MLNVPVFNAAEQHLANLRGHVAFHIGVTGLQCVHVSMPQATEREKDKDGPAACGRGRDKLFSDSGRTTIGTV